MQAPNWYDAWCEEAFAAFTAKQRHVAETFRLETWERYDYDANEGVLTFSDGHGPRVVCDIQVLGATADGEWRWGWAAIQWRQAMLQDVERVRAFGVENGVEELTTPQLRSDDLDGLGWMLAAIAARVVEAQGAYRVPAGAGGLYLILRSLKFVS